MRVLAFLILPLALLASACAGGMSSRTEIAGPEWIVETMGGKPVVEGSVLTFVVSEDGKVMGNSGCDAFFGLWRYDHPTAPFHLVISPAKACAEGLKKQEQRFLGLLQLVENYRVVGDQLSMTTSTGTTMLCRRASVAGN